MEWQLGEAQRRFSTLVQLAIEEGPQMVTDKGKALVAILAIEEYEQLYRSKADFVQFLLQGPDLGQLDLTRDRTLARVVELVNPELKG